MGVVVELERYRQEVAKQRGRRCTDCGSLCLDRRMWGKALICEGCEAKLIAYASGLNAGERSPLAR